MRMVIAFWMVSFWCTIPNDAHGDHGFSTLRGLSGPTGELVSISTCSLSASYVSDLQSGARCWRLIDTDAHGDRILDGVVRCTIPNDAHGDRILDGVVWCTIMLI